MKNYLNSRVYKVSRSPIREFAAMAASVEGCLSLTLGEPDFDTPECVNEQVPVALANHETHYIHNCGSMELRKKIADFENERYGMDYKPTETIVTVGATEAIYTALYGVLNEGDEVIIFTPAFLLYDEAAKLCGGKPVFVDTTEDGFQVTKEKLEAAMSDKTKVIIINTPNNPTGCVLNKESLDIIHDAVKDKPIFVICDDVYRQLTYTDDYHSFMEYRDLREQLILVQSFSKPYAMTGWRMGYLIADASIEERLELVHQYLITSTPAPFQRACMAAIDFDPTPFKESYVTRRDYVLERLEKMKLEVTKPDGAFYVFPSIKEFNMTSLDFCTRLVKEAKVAVTPGFCFGSDTNFRISYCCSQEVLVEAMNRLEKFVNELRKG
ncbi:MAG: aminotransferase class I/II-fold pyridoxal phosphate-dependent enzyme [Erysipelotrichaceae bacterium]|nr:aminotransferase class I/II-fold pyridoxal phosphate-dependent enzyme [Erysipelotrichaceae bacterium]